MDSSNADAGGDEGADAAPTASETDPAAAGERSADDEELAELRAAVEEKYDFDDFGPADMAKMSADEWEAAFDAETWITGEELLDRVVDDLKTRIANRQIFAVIEREEDQLLVYSDEGYAVVSPDGTVEGQGGVRRDVEPIVAMCSMDEYEVPEPPEEYELPSPESVAEQTGEFGNLMVQIIAGGQLISGLALLIAFAPPLRLIDTLVAPVIGAIFVVVGLGLFLLVANARLSDRFRSEQYRNRLRAVEIDGVERPDIELESAATEGRTEAPQEAAERDTDVS
jgi:hypothetical protein